MKIFGIYLIIGLLLTVFLKIRTKKDYTRLIGKLPWWTDLMIIFLWPVTLIVGIVNGYKIAKKITDNPWTNYSNLDEEIEKEVNKIIDSYLKENNEE